MVLENRPLPIHIDYRYKSGVKKNPELCKNLDSTTLTNRRSSVVVSLKNTYSWISTSTVVILKKSQVFMS